MAAEQAKQFLQTISNDASIRAQIRSVATINDIMDFALSRGFVFTEEDLKTALKEFPENIAVDKLRDTLKIPRAVHRG